MPFSADFRPKTALHSAMALLFYCYTTNYDSPRHPIIQYFTVPGDILSREPRQMLFDF
jgi:hypothetical protein